MLGPAGTLVPASAACWVIAMCNLDHHIEVAAIVRESLGKTIRRGSKVFTLGTADRLAIWAHVVIHGGEMSHYLDNSVTHVVVAKATGNFYDYVTTMLTNDSTDSESNTKPVLVTPDWIVDCLAQNSLLACESYHPNLLVRRTPPPSQLPSPSSSKQMSVKQQQQLNEPKESDMHKNSNNDISLNSLIKQESNLIINSTLSGGDLMMNNNHSYVTVDSTSSTVNPNINTNTITTNTAISNILNCTNNVQQQQSSQIITSKQNLVQNNQIMHTLQSSSQQLSSVLSGGTNVQAATGLSVQQINMRAVEQKAKYDGVTPSRPGRGGHSRGGGSGRGSSKKATQDQSRSGNQQQQQQQRFSISSPLANRNPVAQNIAAPQRFPVSGAQGSVNQRFPSGLPIYTDPTVQQGMVQQITGSDIIGNSNSSGSNYSGCSMPGNHTNVILSNSFLPISANSAISSGALSITTPTTNLISISSNSTSSTGHHAKTSKSKSSKHMQEQNLNEEEKDAIVMQNVKNILSLQHTWNRESSHGRGSSSATSSSDNHSSSNNSGHGQNGPNSLSGLQGGNSSSLGNLITSGYGGSSSNLGSSQTSGNHRKPKSPKSPCRAVGSTMGHKVSPKSPKNAKVTGITKTLPAPHQQHIQQQQQQQQQQPQQQPSIVMAGCAGSALPSVLLTGSLQQMQYRPASNNSLQGTPSQLQRSTSMQHYLTTATLASHQPQSAPGTPAYIVQRHPCGQLVASVSQQSTHGQLHTQSFPVQNPYQRASGILTAVNTSNLGQQQHQQSSQQNQASVQHFQHAAQIQQPTLFNENIDAQPDMATIISSDGSGDILLTSNHNPHQHHNHNPHQISASNIIQSSSNHLYQSNHQSGHNSAIEQTHSHNKQTVNSQPITQQLLLQSTGGNGGGGGGSATIGVGNGSQLIQIKSTAYTSPIQQTLLSETNHQQQQHHMVASVASSSINNSQSTPAMIIDNRTPHQQQMISQSNCSITTTPTSTPHHHHQQQSVQLHIALHSPGNNTSSLNTGTPGGGGGNTSGNQIKSSPSNLISQHSSMVGGKMSQLQQQIQTQSSPTRPSVNNRQYVQQQPQHQQPQIQHQYSASLATHPAQHYQQHQQQPQQQKIQLSPATATIPAQYQAIHGCYTPQPQQSQQQQQQQQPHQNQHPQQIIFQSPTGQQIIAAQHQSVPNAFARNSNNPTPSGGMLLRSVLPCSGNANTPGNGFHQNQSSLVTVSTNQRPVPQMTNRPQTNKVLFQTSPTPQSNNNNISIHGLQQQAIHQQHQQPIPTYPQQVHSGGIITGQQSKPNHQMVYAQSAGRQNTQVIIGDSSSVSVINAPNQHHQTNTIHSPYHHVATPNLVHGNGFDHSISPRPTHPQVVPMPSHSHSSTATTVSANVQTPPRPNQIPVTTVVQSVNRQITCNSTPGNTQNTPTLMTPMQLTPAYHGHDGNPLPSRPEECLIGCVMLILGYRSVPESQKVVWRRVMRLHGAEVVLAYDPTRVTHVVIDCQLEEPDVIKQVNCPYNNLKSCKSFDSRGEGNRSVDSLDRNSVYQGSISVTASEPTHYFHNDEYDVLDEDEAEEEEEEDSLTEECSLFVIPSSSPPSSKSWINNCHHRLDIPSHHCANPIECVSQSIRTRNLLHETNVISYLSPFRPFDEKISNKKLLERRLDTYFKQYPPEFLLSKRRSIPQEYAVFKNSSLLLDQSLPSSYLHSKDERYGGSYSDIMDDLCVQSLYLEELNSHLSNKDFIIHKVIQEDFMRDDIYCNPTPPNYQHAPLNELERCSKDCIDDKYNSRSDNNNEVSVNHEVNDNRDDNNTSNSYSTMSFSRIEFNNFICTSSCIPNELIDCSKSIKQSNEYLSDDSLSYDSPGNVQDVDKSLSPYLPQSGDNLEAIRMLDESSLSLKTSNNHSPDPSISVCKNYPGEVNMSQQKHLCICHNVVNIVIYPQDCVNKLSVSTFLPCLSSRTTSTLISPPTDINLISRTLCSDNDDELLSDYSETENAVKWQNDKNDNFDNSCLSTVHRQSPHYHVNSMTYDIELSNNSFSQTDHRLSHESSQSSYYKACNHSVGYYEFVNKNSEQMIIRDHHNDDDDDVGSSQCSMKRGRLQHRVSSSSNLSSVHSCSEPSLFFTYHLPPSSSKGLIKCFNRDLTSSFYCSKLLATLQSPTPLSVSPVFKRVPLHHSLDCLPSALLTTQSSLPSNQAKSLFYGYLFKITDVIGIKNAIPNGKCCLCTFKNTPTVKLSTNNKSSCASLISEDASTTSQLKSCSCSQRVFDCRLCCILKRYPQCRADILQHVQSTHGNDSSGGRGNDDYVFLIVYAKSLCYLFCVIGDIDYFYPHWQLSKQLHL
ncbi:unnamed protein product [Trichobilharzia regenti]|nr:unnamed protein product [Trichobilharzia regenti]